MTDQQSANQPPGAPADPRSAQEWADQVTSQGTPPDYKPPAAPGQRVEMPDGPPAGAPPVQGPPGSGEQATIISTAGEKQDGLDKCPRCGSTEVSLRAQTGMLICHFCRHQWAEATIEDTFGLDSPIDQLRGRVIGSGASNIPESTEQVLTLKCGACGAEVVVNTEAAMQSRCHWCRNTLSINQQLPNGAVPDGLLPFTLTKEQAVEKIDEFVKKRRFYAHPKFV